MASPNVFISYASDTKPLAEELTLALQGEGIHTWAGFKDLKPGRLWKDEIEHALEDTQAVVILVSPDSRPSRRTEVEWQLALKEAWAHPDKVFLPVLLRGSETPPFLRNWAPLSIDPDAEPQWTSDVLKALRSAGSRFVQGTPAGQQRQERQARLAEIAHAMEEVRRRESHHVH
jgi:hypothetical protein